MVAKRHTLVNALRVAAEEYAKAALIDPNLRQTFEDQAVVAIDLALEIENAETIRLED
jgi:hypothetical protein